MLRVETTINNPGLPGLKLKKPACNLQAYYWYGLKCNSRYFSILSDIDITTISSEVYEKYRQPIITKKGVRVAAPDLRNQQQLELFTILLSDINLSLGFKNKHLRAKMKGSPKTEKIAYELRKLRVRGAIKKIKNSHYYQLTREGYTWLYYSLFNYSKFTNPLLSKINQKEVMARCSNPSEIEKAYTMINDGVSCITKAFSLVA